MAFHLELLDRRGVGVAVLLPVLWTSLAVNAATPACRPRPNSPRSRVTRRIPCTGQAHEAIEPLWVTAGDNDLIVPTSDPGAADLPSSPLPQLTCSGIVVGGFVANHSRFTVASPAQPRGPPLVSRYPLI